VPSSACCTATASSWLTGCGAVCSAAAWAFSSPANAISSLVVRSSMPRARRRARAPAHGGPRGLGREVGRDRWHAASLTPASAGATAEPSITTELYTSPQLYQLTTKQGTTTFQTGAEWLAAWAKLVRGCKAAKVLDKLQTARETNRPHTDAVVATDPETAATLTAQLDRALSACTPSE
jgi:hypothetical protein